MVGHLKEPGRRSEVLKPSHNSEWLRSPFSSFNSQLTMSRYELNFTVPSPGNSTTFMDFSTNGRFLAVGDRDFSSLYILDRFAGFHPKISAVTLAPPTSLVWETAETLYVGMNDGHFVHYRVDLKENKLAEIARNCYLREGGFPINAMALDAGSRTLVTSAGPGVFVFRRTRATGGLRD